MEERIYRVCCDECQNVTEWKLSQLHHTMGETLYRNVGYIKESQPLGSSAKHYCSNCNDRDKETFHIVGGEGKTYLGVVEAWGKLDARRTARETFDEQYPIEYETEQQVREVCDL